MTFNDYPLLTMMAFLALGLAATLTAGESASAASGVLIKPPSPELGRLLGPLTPISTAATTGGITAFDQVLLTRGREFAETFPGKVDKDLSGDGRIDVGDYVFYDLPLVLYRIYYRTGEVVWRDRARTIGKAWSEHPGNRKIAAYLAKE